MNSLHRRFEARVAVAGDSIAVTDRGRHWTYAELNESADRLAHRLRAAGVGRETLAALCADRSAEQVVAVLAVLKAGGAYVPLDPYYPPARLRQIMAGTRCTVVVTQSAFRSLFGNGPRVIVIDDPCAPSAENANPAAEAGPGQAAYVIHTSGSTGTPKGVVVTHANVLRLFGSVEPMFGFSESDVWALFHSLSFDFSVWELWGALLHGGRLVIVPYTTSRAPQEFFRLVRDEKVTVLSQTPSAFGQLAQMAAESDFPPTDLRLVVFGGEALRPAALKPWFDGYGDERPRLVNMYGITETTVHVTARAMSKKDIELPGSPIGRPLPGVTVHLLDDTLNPVPAGRPGEIYVGGPGLARGYLGRPALSAERFVANPFGPPGDRLYRSGDIASLTPDGELMFHGRSDRQVNLRGFRVEPGEIESVLLRSGIAREAVVLQVEESLVGFVVAPDGVTSATLRAVAAEQLPSHLVPSWLVIVASIPLTVNGKVDQDALAALWRKPEVAQAEWVEPDPVRALSRIWMEQLGHAAVSPHDNFFALGGDSMSAVRMVAQARAHGIMISVPQVFRLPTIAELVAAADAESPGKALPDKESLLAQIDRARLPQHVADAYPMTTLQLGMVYQTEATGDPTYYHDLVSMRVSEAVDVDALSRALATLAARHEVLRTSFDLGRFSEPLQLVAHRATIPLICHSLPGGPPEEGLRAWWRAQWQRAFDVETAPLLRCHVLRHPEAHYLAITTHHAILDGWSISYLIREMLENYDAQLRSEPPRSTSPPAARFADFVALERAAAQSPSAASFFSEMLEGVPDIKLPSPTSEPAQVDPDVVVTLAQEQIGRLQTVAGRLLVPLKSVFLAAHVWALAKVFQVGVCVTGVVGNGRPEEGAGHEVLGLFLNSLPLRAEVGEGSWIDLMYQMHEAERDLMPYRRHPLSAIQARLGAAPFSVLFNYTSFAVLDGLRHLKNVKVEGWWASDRTGFPVVIEVAEQPLSAGWEVSARVDHRQTAASVASEMVRRFRQALDRIADDPAGPAA